MADEEQVEIVIRLKDLQSFISGTEEAAVSLRKIGTATKETAIEATTSLNKVHGVVGRLKEAAHSTASAMSNMAHKTAAGYRHMRSNIEGVASKSLMPGGPVVGTIAGMAAGALSIETVKSAIESTTELAKNAKAFHEVTGMTNKDAVGWQALTQAYGVNARAFGISMKSVATQFETATSGKGGKKSVALFKDMGIGMNQLKAHGHDMNSMLGTVIDHFNKMPGGAEKTAIATKLFGRSWQQLMPLLGEGSKKLAEQRKEAAAYGVTLNGNATKNAMRLHEAQIKLKLATMGLKVQFAENLAPALFTVFGWIMKLYAVIAKNMNPAFKLMGQIVHDVTGYFKTHHDMLKKLVDVLKFVALAYLAIKIQILACKVAAMAMQAWGSLTNPWVLAIMAVIVIVILLVKHWKAVKGVVNSVVHWVSNAWNNIKHAVTTAITATINFLKKWWPLIVGIFTGPIGLVIALFVKFHNQIISAMSDAWNYVKSIPGKILDLFTSQASSIVNAITQPFKDAWHWLSSLQIHIKHTHIGPVSVPSGISVTSAQHGGLHGGLTWVGEAGPELVNLPGGSRVQPHSTTTVGSVQQTDKVLPPFVISVQIQRQEIARAVGKYTTDRLARR
jgi:hypothetical protein